MNEAATPAVPDRVELVTSDLDAVRLFYRDLFGWSYTETGDGATAYADGAPAASLRAGAAPARWWPVFAAPDADEVCATAVRAGARLDGEDVHDPFGGGFRVRAGATAAPPGPGRPCWYEYMTVTPAEVDRFHHDTLGLRADPPPGAPDDSYVLLSAAGRPVAGRLTLPAPLAELLPTGWMVYFAVADPDRAAERADRLGGRLLVPPRDVPTGRVAALADPAGAVFTVIRPAAPGA
ncbi:VOC family protein [Micromonospora cathayae]|uniref:VOC family protein n=1 Tax=Micromonospora cathayae TaxID=3028804 RepID=A0ABY7ZLC2_9ACTN|nr:VOC family protein [Micromonospora sp. HUAS 3]WDZ83581.1 VOC family protein [Micromonospora sp. HUAS 3]